MATHRVLPKEADLVQRDHRIVAQSAENGIRRGDNGADVRGLQRELHNQGFYNAAIDGDFGPITQAAVRGFQKSKGLAETGVVNKATSDALRGNDVFVKARFVDNPAQRGQSGTDILRQERKLSALGYNTGKVDGIFTQQTVKAVRAFRKDTPGVADENNTMDTQFRDALAKRYEKSPLAVFQNQAPKDDYTRVSHSGVTINKRTQEMIQRAETIMAKKYGHPGFKFDLVQGSYSNAVGASAGTHGGGGAVDISDRAFSKQTVDHMVKALREAGFAAWSRGRGHDSFDPHIHAIAIGDKQMSSQARSQVTEYKNGGDGLVGSAPDPDRNLGRNIPKWAQGL